MKDLIYALVAPRSADAETRSRELTLNILLLGTIGLALSAVLIVTINLIVMHQSYVIARWAACAAALSFFLSLYALSRRGHYKSASYVFVLTYFLIVAGMVWAWGIQIPQGILLAAFVIIISGILLGSRYALYAALLDSIVLTAAFYGAHPDTGWKESPATSGDIVVFGITFGLIAAVCWLFDSQIERSLNRAERSEAALKKERDSLEVKVEERTKKLQAVQLEQMQQVYRFAELGLVSTALLHDLANHLSAISVDIEGLTEERSSRILARVKRTIGYIDSSVQKTRAQLQGHGGVKQFSVTKTVAEVATLLTYQASEAHVRLEVRSEPERAAPKLKGDVLRFKQLLTNLVANAIEAYDSGPSDPSRQVTITTVLQKQRVTITVADQGRGMTEEQQANLFKSFYTTKERGMGLGLFIAKEIVEKGFGGSIKAKSNKKGTTFAISLPLEKA
jgi:signal transduction histidine kinase